MSSWKTLSSRIVYKNPFMRVHEDSVINPAGEQTVYGYCESTEGAAYIIPIDDEGQTYIIRQYRYPVKKMCWEAIAGRIPHDEDLAQGAKRELLEETGLEAGELVKLGEVLASSGISTFAYAVFLARKLRHVSDQLDEADGITDVKRLTLKEVDDMIAAGDIQCSPSISAFHLANAFLEREKRHV